MFGALVLGAALGLAPATGPEPTPRPELTSASPAGAPLPPPRGAPSLPLAPRRVSGLGPSDPVGDTEAPAAIPLPPPRGPVPQRRASPRPERLAALPPVSGLGTPGDRPLLCGDARLEGFRRSRIRDGARPCGVPEPIELRRVSGIALEPPAVLSCATAEALADWLDGTVTPAARVLLSARPTGLQVAASYICRTRNHQPGARISEHGFGRAIDISSIRLDDGRRVAVLSDWGRGAEGRFLARIRSRACGPFTTVLGPGSDRWHDDHFHLDTAPGRGTWCR